MLNERLKTAREAKGLTRKKMAEILCIHDTTYGKYELGIREPSIELINEIARLLGVSAAYLIGETDDPTPLKNELKDIIRNKRENLGYTQAQIAELLGLNEIYIERIESGTIKPSLGVLDKLCDILELEMLIDTKKDYSADTEQSEDIKKLEKLLNNLNTEQLKGVIDYVEYLTSRHDQ